MPLREKVMSFETISIYRDLPIKNDFVQVPPNVERDNQRTDSSTGLTTITDGEIVRLPSGSGKSTGSKFGQQTMLRLPPIRPDAWYTPAQLAEIDSL